ncbi:2Fe-2S iron-sulfur cluster-binding protein [Streptomyces sp. NL15-2K]|uniref:2Fe-2S iron-sulfur cluster-binding protein n=1 Tax=Streptomyces sp. NL15-2K TaxID=376149 RepID=UPI000F573A28|nr:MULTISPECIES: 2Fe-2S iron-sulfur cluster-binding protein [Actinomycetes]WKX13925.1 2Fe-2S iron-sulfur cluster-binding protein [Kutzneria buriramensis]GCB50888.1 ferredoxin [Streptomyces sp. NL15-2K]
MPKITYVSVDKTPQTIDVPLGTSVMRGAVSQGVDGIVALCGGNLQCATCHVYVDPETAAKTVPIGSDEGDMLEYTASPRRPESRLSCQLEVTDALDGLIVHLPEKQR